MNIRISTALAAAILTVSCTQAPAKPKPTLLPAAMKGDYVAQRRLAVCYEEIGGCPAEGVIRNTVEACAWRATILASRNPNIELADGDRYTASCVKADQPTAQRAYTRAAELIHQVYGRSEAVPFRYVASSDNPLTLYPSAEMIRIRMNADLEAQHDVRRFPVFGPPADGEGPWKGLLKWHGCDRDLCLNAFSPPWGGGVVLFAVGDGSKDPASIRFQRASRLAGAALGAPSMSDQLVTLASSKPSNQVRSTIIGTTCWGGILNTTGQAVIGASLAPCRQF